MTTICEQHMNSKHFSREKNISPWNQPIPPEYQMDNSNLDRLIRRISLLSSAEESFCQAASVLQPTIKDALEWLVAHDCAGRLQTGLHLLEEAMGRHNAYMESLK